MIHFNEDAIIAQLDALSHPIQISSVQTLIVKSTIMLVLKGVPSSPITKQGYQPSA